MIDGSAIGHVAAQLMEDLEREHPDGTLVEVGIVAEVDVGDRTLIRTACSSDRLIVQVGLFEEGLVNIREGVVVDEDDDDD